MADEPIVRLLKPMELRIRSVFEDGHNGDEHSSGLDLIVVGEVDMTGSLVEIYGRPVSYVSYDGKLVTKRICEAVGSYHRVKSITLLPLGDELRGKKVGQLDEIIREKAKDLARLKEMRSLIAVDEPIVVGETADTQKS